MNIKNVFDRYGLSVTEVAKRMDVTLASLSATINGNPTYQMLCKIASAVGCTPSELISDEPECNSSTITCPKCGTKFKVEVKPED